MIPEMTHPLGKHWDQPKLQDISFSLLCAYMSYKDFNLLKTYQTSTPTGVYEGKMWKCLKRTNNYGKPKWLLCYYEKLGPPDCSGQQLYIIKSYIIHIV